jgi:hypothetical protein
MNRISSISQIEDRIQQIKTQLAGLGPMRPGSLSRQYNVCGKPGCRCKDPKKPQRHGPYYQLSWVHRGQSTTQFIRPGFVAQVQAELATYRTFRMLTAQWVELALQAAQRRLQAARDTATRQPK